VRVAPAPLHVVSPADRALQNEIVRRELIGMRHIDLHLRISVAIDRDIDGGGTTSGVGRLPRHAGPIAGVVGRIGDEGEGLVAVERGVGIDARQVDLVLALREVVDLIVLEDAVDHDALRLFDGCVLEDIGALAADEIVSAEPAPQRIVADAADNPIIAAISAQNIVAGIALQVVVARTARKTIATNDIIAVAALDGVIAVTAGQLIIAAGTEDLIIPVGSMDRICIGIAAERIGEIAEIDPFDRVENVALSVAGPGRRGFGEIDADARGGVEIARGVKSVASDQSIGAAPPSSQSLLSPPSRLSLPLPP
jgi:hypothetical protein